MPRVSRIPLDKNIEQEIKETFLEELVGIIDKNEMTSLLERLLTDQEKIMLAKRLVSFVMIDKGIPDTQIGKMLHLTRETVIRFRLVYTGAKDKNEHVVKVIKDLQLKKKFVRLFKQFITGYALPAALGKIPKMY